MATNVATLTATLEADTRKFERSMKSASNDLKGVKQSSEQAAKSGKQIESSYKNVARQMGISEDEAKDLTRAMAKSTRESSELEDDLKDIARALGLSEKEAGKFARQMGNAGGKQKLLDRQLGNTGLTLRHGIAAGAAVAGAAVVKMAVDSVNAASNLGESLNALEVVYKENADGLKEIGQSAAENFGMSQRAFNEFAVRFSAFADNIANESGRQVVDVVEEMTTRVADFASVHNLSLEEAAQVAQSTLAGETEVFRRFGGDVSAAAVNAKALELGLAGVGNELTEQEKQLVRYQLFMEQTADTAGDFANTSDNLANLQRILAATWEDAQAELGKAFIPALEDVLPVLIDVAKAVGDAAINLAEFLGAVERVDAALIRYGIRTGGATDTTTALANAARDVGNDFVTAWGFTNLMKGGVKGLEAEMLNLVTRFEGGKAELVDLQDNFDLWVDILGLSEQEAAALAKALETQLSRELTNTEERARDAFEAIQEGTEDIDNLVMSAEDMRDIFEQGVDPIRDVEDAFVDTGLSAEEAARAMGAFETAVRRLTDPVFKAINDQTRLKDAQDAYNEAVRKFSEDSPQATEAGFALAEANQAALMSARDLPGELGLSTEAILNLAREAGAGETVLRNMKDAIDSIDGSKAAAEIEIELKAVGAIDSRFVFEQGTAVETSIPIPINIPEGFQHGGPFTANTPMIVGERGPELVQFDRSGMVEPDVDKQMETQQAPIQITQNFHRVEGDSIETDIARGLILSGLGRFIETGF